MAKVIEIDLLNAKSLDAAITKIEAYKKSLEQKCELLCSRLCDIGIPVIRAKISSAMGDSSKAHSVYYNIQSNGAVTDMYIYLTGEDILFIEFGAGIYYNNGAAHPKASELGFGVGTYPGQTHAINPGYWWYKDDTDDTLHFSRGTEATMPMYSAMLTIKDNVLNIAQEVFNVG